MSEVNLEIGDKVRLEDGEQCVVKYAWKNGRFLDEINEMHNFNPETREIIEKNQDLKNLNEFTELEQQMLMFFHGGENKKRMHDTFTKEDYNKRELDFVFKGLHNNGYLVQLFENKYLSKILKQKLVVKVK